MPPSMRRTSFGHRALGCSGQLEEASEMSKILRALRARQPFAELFITGEKPIEFRSRRGEPI
jgi:hypothetical protein